VTEEKICSHPKADCEDSPVRNDPLDCWHYTPRYTPVNSPTYLSTIATTLKEPWSGKAHSLVAAQT